MPGRVSRRAKWILIALGVVVLAGVLPPFLNVNRYRSQVAAAIGRALGREVTVSTIELKMMPRPGMVLSGFVVADAPDYGVEPMLRCDTVTAYLRLTSLWRGKLEIGTLALENPSLNLVRREDGRWNLEDLLQRTSQAQTAPTSHPNPESRTRFPYVEATAGRINFKLGNVKKRLAFSDADFALWLETEDRWGVRLEARPTRSDVPVSETGTLRVEGEFQRAARLEETPIKLKANYTKGQLGQVTTLIFGRDRGWRGALTASAVMAGTPASLAVTADGGVDDFRRYDIALGQALRLSAHCTGSFSSHDDSLRSLQCQAPVRPGLLMVRGDVMGWNFGAFNLGFTAEQIPLERFVALARHTKKDLPDDLTANGSADALFTVRREPGAAPVWTGGGHTTRFALKSSVLKEDLELGPIELAITENPDKHGVKHLKPNSPAQAGSPLRVVLKPFAMPLGATSPATAEGYFDLAEYKLNLRGDAELSRLLAVARAMGMGAPAVGVAGKAQVDFAIAGSWTGFAPPLPSGKLQIRETTAEFPGLAEPMQIGSATITMSDQVVAVNPFLGSFPEGPRISGNASFPLRCTSGESCLLNFDLHTPELSLTDLRRLLNPSLQSRPWYHLLALGQRDNNALLKVHAIGHVSVGKLAIGNLIASNATAGVEIKAGVANLREFKADVLGGKHLGNWDADFTTSPPKFYGSGSFTKLAMTQVSAVMHDAWATGTLTGQYTIGMSGLDKTQLSESAAGSAGFKWRDGSFKHVTLEGKNSPLTFTSFEGEIALRNQVVSCQQCVLQTRESKYTLSGSAGLDRSLDLTIGRSGSAEYAISGALASPVVRNLTTISAAASQR